MAGKRRSNWSAELEIFGMILPLVALPVSMAVAYKVDPAAGIGLFVWSLFVAILCTALGRMLKLLTRILEVLNELRDKERTR